MYFKQKFIFVIASLRAYCTHILGIILHPSIFHPPSNYCILHYLPVHISTCVFSFFFFSLRRKLYTTTKPNSRASHKGKRKIQKPKAKPKIRKGFTEPIGINARKIHATRTKISRDFSNKRLVCTEEGEAHSLLFVTRDTNTGI